jgi:hypothetical protein
MEKMQRQGRQRGSSVYRRQSIIDDRLNVRDDGSDTREIRNVIGIQRADRSCQNGIPRTAATSAIRSRRLGIRFRRFLTDVTMAAARDQSRVGANRPQHDRTPAVRQHHTEAAQENDGGD